MVEKRGLRALFYLALATALTLSLVLLVGRVAISAEKIIIDFWQPFGEIPGETIEVMVKQYNAAYPAVEVKVTFAPGVTAAGTNPKLLAAIAGGTPPDVVIHDGSSFTTWVAQGASTAIDDLVKQAGIVKEDYFPFSWEKVNFEGRIWGLPFDTDVRALYYNKDMFSEAGLDPEKPPRSIEDLDRYADKLTKYGPAKKLERFGILPWGGNWFLCGWAWSFGAKLFDPKTNKIALNHPKMVEALDWEVAYAKKYGIQTISAFASGWGGGAQNPFISGKVAMDVTGDWVLADIRRYGPQIKFGLAIVPYPSGGEATTWSGGFVFAIPRGSKHLKEAWKFMSFMAGPYGQYVYNKLTTHIPTNILAALDPAFTADPEHKFFIDLLPVSHTEPVIPEWALGWDEMIAANDAAINLKKTAKQALDEANAKVQAEIDKRLKKR